MQRLQDAGERGGGAPGGRQAHQAHQQPRQRRAHARTTPQREQLSPQPSTRRRTLAGHQHTCKARLTRARAPHPTQNDPASHARQERASESRPSMHSKGGINPVAKGGPAAATAHAKARDHPEDRPEDAPPSPPVPPRQRRRPCARFPPIWLPCLCAWIIEPVTGGGSQLKVGRVGDRCGGRSNAVRMPRIAGCESGRAGVEGRAGARGGVPA